MSRTYLREFDATEFAELYREMDEGLVDLSGEEVFIFVGMSGAGKSTAVNFYLGDEMEKCSDDTGGLRYEVKSSQGKSAKIGHEATSQTLFPAAYETVVDGSKSILVDSAGLGDTRGPNVSLCVSLALKKISEKAKVKGIVVVLRAQGITEPRAPGVRQAFDLVRQLTKELSSDKLAFCITGLTEAQAAIDPTQMKASLLRKAHEVAAAMEGELRSDDPSAEEARHTIDALRFMNESNMFLMTDLANRETQEARRKAFFSYLNGMSALREGLSLPMDETTRLKLSLYATTAAQAATTLLSDRKAAYAACNDTEQKQKETARLHAELNDALSRLPAVDALATLETNMARLRANLASLTREQNETVALEPEFPKMRLPKLGAGVGSVIRREVTINGYPSFASLEEKMGTRIISSDRAGGTFTAEVSHVVTGRETDAFITGGVKVHVLKRNMPTFQAEMDAVASELDALERAAAELGRERKTYEAKILKLQTEIRGRAGDLGLTLCAEDAPGEMVAQLAARRDEWNAQLVTLQARKTDFDTKFNAEKGNYQFLFEVAGHTDLDKKNPRVAEFMPLYAEAAGVRYVAPMTSPTRAQMSMFGSTTAAANTHFAATHHDAQQQYRDPAATLVAGH